MKTSILSVLFFSLTFFSIAAEDSPKWETYHLENDVCEALVSAKPIVRLLSFRLKGKTSPLIDYGYPRETTLVQIMQEGHAAGAKFWFAPDEPASYDLGKQPAKATASKHAVSCLTSVAKSSGMQARVDFELDPIKPKITLSGTLINQSGNDKMVAGWWPVAVQPKGVLKAKPAPAPIGGFSELLSLHYWLYGANPDETFFNFSKEIIQMLLDKPVPKRMFKVGFLSNEAELTTQDYILKMSQTDPVFDPKSAYPDGSSLVFFRNDDIQLAEAEFFGPVSKLSPGGESKMSIALEFMLSSPEEK